MDGFVSGATAKPLLSIDYIFQNSGNRKTDIIIKCISICTDIISRLSSFFFFGDICNWVINLFGDILVWLNFGRLLCSTEMFGAVRLFAKYTARGMKFYGI